MSAWPRAVGQGRNGLCLRFVELAIGGNFAAIEDSHLIRECLPVQLV